MDLLYSEHCFRRYFKSFDKYKGALPVGMEEESVGLKIAGLVNTLKLNANRTQIQCCMYELANVLDNTPPKHLDDFIDDDIYEVILTNMNRHANDGDIQRDGLFCLYLLLKDNNEDVKDKVITLRIHCSAVECMATYPDDIIIQAIGCRIINVLVTDNDTAKQDVIAMNAIYIVINAIDHFDDEDDLQLSGLQIMALLLKSNIELQKTFLQKKYIDLVLERLENLKESSELAEENFKLLGILTECDNFLYYLTEDIITTVFNIMQYHEDCSGVQYAGISFLLELAKNVDAREYLISNDIDNVILRAQIKHCKRDLIQKKCIELFQLLCESLLCVYTNNEREDKVQDWLNVIMVAMGTHCDNPFLLIAACDCLSILAEYHPDYIVLIDDQDGHTPLHNAIMAALALHFDDSDLCKSACRAIANCAMHSQIIQQDLFTKGVYLHIIKAMETHSQVASVQQYGCQALRILCLPSVKNMKEVVGSEGWDLITKCLLSFHDYPLVLQEAIAIIACFATDLEVIRNQCAVENLHIPILQSLQTFKDNVTLIEMAFEIIGVLSACEAMPDLLVSDGVLTTVLDAMDRHIDHWSIQQKGCILLQVFSSYLEDDCCVRTVSAIIRAMQKFHDNDCLQEEACVALKLIAQISPNCSEILVNQCAHERLFAILDQFRTKRKLIQLASGVLWFLGCTRKLQSRMLLSACAGGLIRGAHCLIQLEADVNVGEGTNTPLCAACKNNKEDMVRFLLTQGITDIQTPFNLCLEMENHNLVGLLLQKMGHDREAGIISWNGLNLGSLHPEWLAPSLSGKAFGFSIESQRYTNYIQCAEKAFKLRFKILQKFTNLASAEVKDREKFQRSALESLSDDDDDDDLLFPTSDEGSMDEQGLLLDKVPLRARSLTGASLPYSSYDPRIVVPLTVGDPILLPRRSQPDTTIITSTPNSQPRQRRTKSWLDTPELECFLESYNSDESKASSLVKERSKSTIDKPNFEFPGPAFIINNTPYHRRKVSEASSIEEDSMPLPRTNSFRRERRKTTYFPRGQTDATVSVLDISRNRISDLSLLAKAGENFLGYLFNIMKLDLSSNQLSELPSEFCEAMPHLRHVSLSNNNFEEFPFCLTDAPRLRHVDLSSNHLQLQDNTPDDVTRSVLVEHLSLANNQLKACPKWLSDLFPGLVHLSVAENDLTKFPETNHKMQCLKILDVSKNKITSIPDSFLERFSALESLNASYNELSVLPESHTDTECNLTTLRIAHNKLTEAKPFFVPRFILRLSKLKVLDISYNHLTCLPPVETWKTTQLKELDISHNSIQRINLDTAHPCTWTSLERFNVSNNNLKDVPKGIGHLTSLTSLDLSLNQSITSLPDEMGRLVNLWDLQVSGLKLDIEESLLTNTRKLVAFFNSKLMNSVPYYRMKLVTVGLEKRGKTTLLNQLLKSKCNQSTNELVIRDWTLRDNKATCKQCHHKSVIYTISTWDLKGREDMYEAFQCFITSRTLYLAVYDVTNGGEEFEGLRPWLQTIHACAPNVPVMLVGTHWDKVPTDKMTEVKNEMKDCARMLFSSPGLPDIKAHVVLNCTQETAGIQALRTSIVDLVVKCKCKGHFILGSRVPQKFVKLQELIERVKITDDREGRWLTEREVKKLLQDNDVLMTDGELGQAVKFLHEAGVLLHYDDPVFHLNDLYFTDPIWLNQLISTVVIPQKTSETFTNGILTKRDLVGLFNGDISAIVQSFLPQFLRLLERYGVALPIRHTEFLVPSRVQSNPPSTVTLPDLTSNTLYRRFYDMAFVPLSFWSRLVTRLLLFLPKMDKDSEDTCLPSSVEYWQSGIQVNWSAQSYFTIFHDTSGRFGSNILAITVPINDYGSHLLGNLVDHVDVLIEEWFPSLCDLDPVQGEPLVTRLCPCIACEGDTCHVFTLQECIEQALRYEDVVCPRTAQLLPVERVAPDVELADLKLQNLLVKEHDLVLDLKKENVLGDGSYGTVFKAKYNDRVVAVKVFHTDGHIDPHRLLRQEVPFLANLRHPSILTLYGVSVRPRALVLEIAPLGSLSSLLSKGEVLSRGLQHRIALQVAEGLAYLHSNEIVYRDMKPHNILMFSMSLSIVINAKISDFGIARYTTMYGLKSSEGTPGYRAPEVVRGDVAYNKKSDLYSFGMLLYELVTGGKRPFEDVRFRNELDAAVMQGKMVDPITDNGSSPWPDVEDLIEHLLEPRADMRPSADQVVDRLSTTELLCLKRAIAVSKEKTVECITVRHDGDAIELWMGSGVSSCYGGQVSWMNLTDNKTEGCQGTGLNDRRVTAITAVHNDYVVVGTQSGTLFIFDAYKHQCLPYFERLSDSIVCLRHYDNFKTLDDVVIAGLADGSLVIYKTRDIKNQNPPKDIVRLCRTQKDGGECMNDCNIHPVACLAIAKHCLYTGCGNDIVVCRLDNNTVEVQRRWSIQDPHGQCVLNIAVGSHIWTSTKDSPYINVWDSSTPVLRHTVDCTNIVNIQGNSRDLRVVSMLLDHKALWVGLATGHVIFLSTKSREPLFMFKRHSGPVRCLAIARRNSSHGKPVSLLMTGGMGYIQRPGFHSNQRDFGYVLVWESDLSAQSERLKDNRIKRCQMTSPDPSQ